MPAHLPPHARSASLTTRTDAFVFEDPRSRALLEQIRAVALSECTVLIVGEAGTGKELVARLVHDLGSRASKPFLTVNCGSLAEPVAPSEPFRRSDAAASGAAAANAAWLDAAAGGTLLLDGVAGLPPAAQATLLHFLHEREAALGATSAGVRLIATTSVQLEDVVTNGHFRADLWHRLNVLTLRTLPLRERTGDILPLARHFIAAHGERLGRVPPDLSPEAAARLMEHAWPGNARELENVIAQAVLLQRGTVIGASDLELTKPKPAALDRAAKREASSLLDGGLLECFEQGGPRLYERIEAAVMRAAYEYCEHNQLQTARLLGISRNIVRARLIQFGELPGTQRSARTADFAVEAEPERPKRSRRTTIRIGYQRFGLLKLVRARGTLERELMRRGLTVEWVEFSSGVALVEAFGRGDVGLGIMGEGPPVIAQAARVPIVYLAAESPAPEGEAIIVPAASRITRVAHLAGKRVALSQGANVHYLLIRALEEAGLAYADVRIQFMPPSAARAAFESGAVDAWVIGDPVLAEAQHALDTRVVRDGTGLAFNPAYYVCTQAFAESCPEVLEALLAELTSVWRWTNEHFDEVVESLAPRLGMAKEPLSVSLRRSSGTRLPGDELIASQQRVADSFFKLELIPRAISVADAAWSVSNAWLANAAKRADRNV